MTPFQRHVQKWSKCTACDSCKHRRKVVLFRGKIPCDVLFTGEAPGQSEDVVGSPFVGPAGGLLQEMIDYSLERSEQDLRIGFTNIVGCIPKGDDLKKLTEPSKESIEACKERLIEIIQLAKPRGIVCVGQVAMKAMVSQELFSDVSPDTCSWLGEGQLVQFREIVHPAAILRSRKDQQGLQCKRVEATLTDLFTNLFSRVVTKDSNEVTF